MSNKSRLQTNNTNLQALINKANALPEAGSGGGGSAEGCVLELLADAPMGEDLITIYSVDPEGQITVTTTDGFDLMLGISIVCLKNSLVYSTTPFFSTMSAVSNTIQRIDGQCIFITGDGTYVFQ